MIGGGGCGLVAALTAAERGAEVLLVEASGEFGGNTALSTGMLPAARTSWQRDADVADTAEGLLADITARNGGDCDMAAARALCTRSGALAEWLGRHVPLRLVTEFVYPGHRCARMHLPVDGYGEALAYHLTAAVRRQRAVNSWTRSPALALLRDGDRVAAARVRHEGNEWTCHARNVLLATDGFGGNPDWIKRYIPEMAGAPYFGAPGNLGDGIAWGEAAGGAVAYMDAYQGHASVAQDGAPLGWVIFDNGGILLNRLGERFLDEARGYSACAREVVAQTGGFAWAVFDEQILQASEHARVERLRPSDLLIRADGIEVLAAATGMPLDKLRASAGTFGPPLYAVRVRGGLFHTQGGLRVDLDGRVLRPDGLSIPGLWAGGGAAAGISGHGAAGYLAGNGLLAALGLGRAAGLATTC